MYLCLFCKCIFYLQIYIQVYLVSASVSFICKCTGIFYLQVYLSCICRCIFYLQVNLLSASASFICKCTGTYLLSAFYLLVYLLTAKSFFDLPVYLSSVCMCIFYLLSASSICKCTYLLSAKCMYLLSTIVLLSKSDHLSVSTLYVHYIFYLQVNSFPAPVPAYLS